MQSGVENPQLLSRDWKRLASDELEVVGNASEKDLRSALKEVQRFRATLLALIPGLTTASHQKTILVVLRDTNSFQRFLPRDGRGRKQENVAGYFLVQPYANVMVLPMFADRDATFRVAFHEYTHYLVYRNMPNLPLWLNEGIADLYSTFSVDAEGRSVIGRAPPWYVAALQKRPIIPLSRFLDPETGSRLFENDVDTSLFYAQAWAFVHFMTLADKGKRRGQILRYLEALETAPSRIEAAARKHFTWVKERGDRNYTEYGLARAELKRLEGATP